MSTSEKIFREVIVKITEQGNKAISPGDYFDCFKFALNKISSYLAINSPILSLSIIETPISNEEHAASHFYSNFECDYDNKRIKYNLTEAFFDFTYKGLYKPDALQGSNENDFEFIKDCATNYLVKNFWHNYVHNHVQNINHKNYPDFADEARYASDFEADNFANILLASSYGQDVIASQSRQKRPPHSIVELFKRNKCNEAFLLREQVRRTTTPKNGKKSLENLFEQEWLIRRRFANRLSIRLLENKRAVTSISLHFFGKINNDDSYGYMRPHTQVAVELNGVRFPQEDLGNVASMAEEDIKDGIEKYVNSLELQYSTHLRKTPRSKSFADESMAAKISQLKNWPTR